MSTNDQVNRPVENRETFVTKTITQYEYEIIIQHHSETIFSYAFESIALQQHSSSFCLRAAHAIERLESLDPSSLVSVLARIELNRQGWEAEAEKEMERGHFDPEGDALLEAALAAEDHPEQSFQQCPFDVEPASLTLSEITSAEESVLQPKGTNHAEL
jgi:hypothetical protein